MLIDENLMRNDLSAPDRAAYTVERADIIKRKAEREKQEIPQVAEKRKGGRPANDGVAATEMAEKTGRNRASVERDLSRGRKFGKSTLDKINGTSLASGVQMDALAELPPKTRNELMKRALSGMKVKAIYVLESVKADKLAKIANAKDAEVINEPKWPAGHERLFRCQSSSPPGIIVTKSRRLRSRPLDEATWSG